MAYDQKFTHVLRYDTADAEGLLDGVCYITPKLDGTNAVVWYDREKQEVCAGSRNRQLSEQDDNAGFYKWLMGDSEEATLLRSVAQYNPCCIFYGEWGVGKTGHIKDYNPVAKTALWLYDIYDTDQEMYLHPKDVSDKLFEAGLESWTIPYTLMKCPTPEELLTHAKENQFLLEGVSHPGEGIVIRRPEFRNKYGNYVIGKLVLDEYVQKQRIKKMIQPGDVEAEMIELYLTDAELDKTKNKVLQRCEAEEFDVHNGKMIGMFMNLAFHDSLLEDGVVAYVSKHKTAVIDFGLLRQLATETCRKYLGF